MTIELTRKLSESYKWFILFDPSLNCNGLLKNFWTNFSGEYLKRYFIMSSTVFRRLLPNKNSQSDALMVVLRIFVVAYLFLVTSVIVLTFFIKISLRKIVKIVTKTFGLKNHDYWIKMLNQLWNGVNGIRRGCFVSLVRSTDSRRRGNGS